MRVGTVPVSVGGNVSFGGTFTTAASGAGNAITLTTATKRVNVAIGQTVTGPSNIVSGSTVYSVSQDGNTVTLADPVRLTVWYIALKVSTVPTSKS